MPRLISRRNCVHASLDATDFQRVIHEYSRTMKRSIPSSLTYAAKIFCERMRALLPISKRTTGVIFEDGHVAIHLDKKIRTRGRGYARQSYREIQRKATGSARGRSYWRGGDVPFRSRASKSFSGENPWVSLESLVPYISSLSAQSGADAAAIHNMTVKFMQMLTRQARRALRKA